MGGTTSKILVNLYTKIGAKYGLSAVDDTEEDPLGPLITTIDNKIKDEISRLRECLTLQIFNADNDNRELRLLIL